MSRGLLDNIKEVSVTSFWDKELVEVPDSYIVSNSLRVVCAEVHLGWLRESHLKSAKYVMLEHKYTIVR